MKPAHEKYAPFRPVDLPDRQWPGRSITKAPVWCSVDLRDGNQALVDPMNLQEKLDFFKALCDMGFKEIEIGFPSASETEYEICRTLIDGGHIPPDVSIQVLVQAREHLIRKTFEAVRGAENVIIHFYNSTSTLQRKVVFGKDMNGIIDIAVEAAQLVRRLTDEYHAAGGRGAIRFEYSPESFSGTEPDNAVVICGRVMQELGASPDNKVILNLPNTVEMSTPNTYADQIEYFIRHLPHRESAVISIHPHNDRGTGVAAAELAVMAGAERVEGTLFGNGERTGNLDIVNMGLNMYTQGVDPGLDFSDLPALRRMFERCTKMHLNERQPYVGELVFTAFSGSHQDAINKGMQYMQTHGGDYWEIPYLPIDPADVGRQYEPVIRINSQSGKGGAAFVMANTFGYHLPKAMHPEFGHLVKEACDAAGRELTANELFDVFRRNYIDVPKTYRLSKHSMIEESVSGAEESISGAEGSVSGAKGTSINGDIVHIVKFSGALVKIRPDGGEDRLELSGTGNGPIDAFFNALRGAGVGGYEFCSYSEHAISAGSDSKAIAYIELKDQAAGRRIFGVGIESNINMASIQGIICAINRGVS